MAIQYLIVIAIALAISFFLWRYLYSFFKRSRIFVGAANQIEKSLSYEWMFLDEILLGQEHHPSLVAFFNEIKATSIDEKRYAVCQLCIAVAAYEGRMQSTLLTTEFVNAYRVFIEKLPEEYRSYYQTTRSLKPFRVVVVQDGKIVNGDINNVAGSKATNAFFDRISDWLDVPLEKSPSRLEKQAFFLTEGLDRRLAVFRFCRIVKGGKSHKNKKKRIIWKPLFGQLTT